MYREETPDFPEDRRGLLLGVIYQEALLEAVEEYKDVADRDSAIRSTTFQPVEVGPARTRVKSVVALPVCEGVTRAITSGIDRKRGIDPAFVTGGVMPARSAIVHHVDSD